MMAELPHNPRRRFLASVSAGFAVVVLMWLVMAAVIFTGVLAGDRAAFDQELYHLMAIRSFAEQFRQPGMAVDLVNYRSATTPGYHLMLAAVARFVSQDVLVLRLVGSLFTLALLATLAGHVARRAGPLMTAVLVLPVGCSLYIFGPGVWLLPDNAAWVLVLAIVILALDRQTTIGTWALGGIALFALVWMRQIHLWAAGLLWLSAWLGQGSNLIHGEKTGERARRVALAVAFTIPAIVMLGVFVRWWGGLVPPLFQGGAYDAVRDKTAPNSTGGNPATPAFVLTLFAVFGVFFLGSFGTTIRGVMARERRVLIPVAIGAAVGLVLAIVPVTSPSFEHGRYSGFWSIAQAVSTRVHDVGGRSVFITLGALVGGAVLGLVWAALPRRDAWILIGGTAGFTLAQSATAFAWQRYLEPFVLLVLVLAAARVRTGPGEATELAPSGVRIVRIVGPIVLAGILAVISLKELKQPPILGPTSTPAAGATTALGASAENPLGTARLTGDVGR